MILLRNYFRNNLEVLNPRKIRGKRIPLEYFAFHNIASYNPERISSLLGDYLNRRNPWEMTDSLLNTFCIYMTSENPV